MKRLYLAMVIVVVVIAAVAASALYYFEELAPIQTSMTAGFNVTGPITVGTPFAVTANLSGYSPGFSMNGTNANITFYWSTDNIAWATLGAVDVPPTGGIASIKAPPLGAGTYFFLANYSGYGRYVGSQSSSESIVVSMASSTTMTQLNATEVALGASVVDTAYITFSASIGPYPVPSGSVTFEYRMGSSGNWQTLATASTAWDAANHRYVAVSAALTPYQTGTYQFNASYGGDANYLASAPSEVTALEVTNVTAATSVASASLNATTVIIGQAVYDNVTVTGLGQGFPSPTGTVQFMNNDTGAWVTFDTETLTGGLATSSAFTANHTGAFFFEAIYSGDGNYTAATSPAEALTVNFKPINVSGYVFNWYGGTLSSWSVSIYGATGSVATYITNSSGYYFFTINQPGNFTITETVQSGWIKISPPGNYTFTTNTSVGLASITGLNFTNFPYPASITGGIYGNPKLVGLSLATNVTGDIASHNVTVTAGTPSVAAVDGISVTNEGLVILFSYNGSNIVTFSGAQFYLYMSQDGYASISPGDIPYAGPFNVSSFSLSFPTAIKIANPFLAGGSGTFYQGAGSINGFPASMLMGPIPLNISQGYDYIKIYDGSVVTAVDTVSVLPWLYLTPSTGPAGAAVAISGNGLQANTQYNLTYSNSSAAFAQVTTDSTGSFTFAWNMKDTGADYGTTPSTNVEIDLLNTATGAFMANSFFNELSRVYLEIASVTGTFGNATGPYNVHVFSSYYFAGNNFNPNGPVVFTIDNSVPLGSVMPNATGVFNASFTIPVLTGGLHNITVTNVGYSSTAGFTMKPLPTLALTPSNGTVGTSVTVQAYGLLAGHVYLYVQKPFSNQTYSYYWLMNTTAGSNGEINGTSTFTIPPMAGGVHTIYLDYNFDGNFTNTLTGLIVTENMTVS